MDDVERMHRAEREGGNVGTGTRELQKRNYIARKESERKRREIFDDALDTFRQGKVKDALIMFEEVKGMEPAKYIGDNFSRVSRIYIVTQYNIACCYSSLKATDPALEAIEDCMHCGFEEYQKVSIPCLYLSLHMVIEFGLPSSLDRINSIAGCIPRDRTRQCPCC
jgi:hypothetical protein